MTRLPVRRGRAGMICERRSVKWVEVVEVEVIVEVVVAVAADGGRAGWAVLRPPVQRAVASALTAGTASRTSLDSLLPDKVPTVRHTDDARGIGYPPPSPVGRRRCMSPFALAPRSTPTPTSSVSDSRGGGEPRSISFSLTREELAAWLAPDLICTLYR